MSRIKYYFSPKRWKSFFIWILRSTLKRLDDSEWTPEPWEIEQYMYRYLRCQDCMQEGECVHSDCKCKMPARAHVRRDYCPTLRWGLFRNEAGWESFKKLKGIIFSLTQKEE